MSDNYFVGLVPKAENQKAHNAQFQMRYPLKENTDEALDLPLYEETPFPPHQEFKWILQRLQDYYKLMYATSLRLLEYLAIGLGKDRYFFHEWFLEDSLS